MMQLNLIIKDIIHSSSKKSAISFLGRLAKSVATVLVSTGKVVASEHLLMEVSMPSKQGYRPWEISVDLS